jgi:hypothetical protein
VYRAKNIPLAAAVTVANNFLKSFFVMTLSSFVLPVAGLLIWAMTSLFIGLALAPTTVDLAHRMIPHSPVLLLEFEGYILAAFLALMVPIYLFRKAEGATFWRRYGRAVMLNLKGSVLVLGVLAVAAVYEAIEIILQLP